MWLHQKQRYSHHQKTKIVRMSSDSRPPKKPVFPSYKLKIKHGVCFPATSWRISTWFVAIHCDALQSVAIHCDPLQSNAIFCNPLQYVAIRCDSCNPLQSVLLRSVAVCSGLLQSIVFRTRTRTWTQTWTWIRTWIRIPTWTGTRTWTLTRTQTRTWTQTGTRTGTQTETQTQTLTQTSFYVHLKKGE